MKIAKKTVVRLAVFTALIVAAVLFDHYFESHPVELDNMETESRQNTAEHSFIYLYNPTGTFSAKTSVLKNPSRKLFEQSHNKHLQEFHQLRNYQVLKSESEKPLNPLVFFCHYITCRHYHFTFPDDDDPFVA